MGLRGRMRSLNILLGIRFGPGAAILPKDVKRIHLDFAHDWNNGHLGPRRFWRQCLPRLKYHNPMVSMTVQRTKDQESKPVMTVHFEDNTTKTIDMQMKMHDAILEELIKTTKAVQVEPSPEEAEELQKIESEKVESEKDRIRTKKHLDKQREDKLLVERARQAVS